MQNYQPIKRLGRGMQGEVWHAKDLRNETEVAIKTQTGQRSGISSAMLYEIIAIRRIASTNTVFLLDTYHSSGTTFTVMPVARKTMLEVTETEKEIYGVRKGVLDLISGLHAIHNAGFAHFDLKPSNILLYSTGLRIADFGSCRRVYHGRQTGSKAPATTVLYSSPEILFGQADIGAPADVWSLALCVYFWCTDELLVEERSLAAVIKRLWNLLGAIPDHLRECVPSDYMWALAERSISAEWKKELASDFQMLIADCLRWDAYQRPTTRTLMNICGLVPSAPLGHLIPSLCVAGWQRFAQHSRAICLAAIGESAAYLCLRAETFLVALQMLDALVWKLPATSDLLVYSTICLHVAAKLIDNVTPNWAHHIAICKLTCGEDDLAVAEADALVKLDYQIRLITAIDALPFYKMLTDEILYVLKWFVSVPVLMEEKVLQALAEIEESHRRAL